MKTDVEIRRDLFDILKASPVSEAITGEVRMVPRKKGSKLEDCIISVLANENGQVQECFVNVNIYVPDILSGGEYVENVPRTNVLSRMCEEFFDRFIYGDGFIISLEKQRILAVEGKDEYCINNRLKYKFLNE